MHLLLGPSLVLVSAGLAVATYAGIRLVSAPPKAPDRMALSVDSLNLITGLGTKLPSTELRQLTTQIGIQARTLLTQFKNAGGSAEGEFMVEQYLEQTKKGLELFLNQSRQRASNRKESLDGLTQLLQTVSDRFVSLQATMDAQDDQAIAGEINLLTKTLTDLDQFSITLHQGNS